MARNCKEYCPYTKICSKYYPKCKGEEGLSHSECPIAWKIEDLLMDAKDNPLPFDDPPEGPDTDELD